jgi:hypothetical protein
MLAFCSLWKHFQIAASVLQFPVNEVHKPDRRTSIEFCVQLVAKIPASESLATIGVFGNGDIRAGIQPESNSCLPPLKAKLTRKDLKG